MRSNVAVLAGAQREVDQWPVFLELSALLPGTRLHLILLGPDVPHAWDGTSARFAAPAAPRGSGTQTAAAVDPFGEDDGSEAVPFVASGICGNGTQAAIDAASVDGGHQLAAPAVPGHKNGGAGMAASMVPICQDDIAHSTAAPAAAVLGDGSGQVGVENSDRHMAAGAEVNPQTDRPRRDAGSADQRVHKGDSISEASCACDHSPHAAQDERASNARPGAAGQQPACHVPGCGGQHRYSTGVNSVLQCQ